MKQYSFLNESSRTVLKHAGELASKKGQLILKNARNRMNSGKEAAKNFAKMGKFKLGYNEPAPKEMVNAYRSAKEAVHKGFAAKHGRMARDITVMARNGKHTIDFIY